MKTLQVLSLNAGLEAVRAGEYGLGFGFVAQQIGKLAEEASIAARDIGNLITGSMQSVRLSVTGAQETHSAMEQIAKAAQDSVGVLYKLFLPHYFNSLVRLNGFQRRYTKFNLVVKRMRRQPRKLAKQWVN